MPRDVAGLAAGLRVAGMVPALGFPLAEVIILALNSAGTLMRGLGVLAGFGLAIPLVLDVRVEVLGRGPGIALVGRCWGVLLAGRPLSDSCRDPVTGGFFFAGAMIISLG